MPARAERIYVYPYKPDEPGQVIGFPLWWDRREFFEKYGDREVDLGHPIYADDALLMAPGEALAWDERCREKFSADPNSQKPHNVLAMQELQSALKRAKWVIVESSEWESGLD